MSKNPPKPNTSPEHVKETAEAYTCPSHIEARERLAQLIHAVGSYDRFHGGPKRPLDDDYPVEVIVQWVNPSAGTETAAATFELGGLRTLLATPTQEGVGHPMADPWRASAELLTAENEALAQTNRRLREGLEAAADALEKIASVMEEHGMRRGAAVIRAVAAQSRAALKDRAGD